MENINLKQQRERYNLQNYLMFTILFISFLFSSYDTFLAFRVKGFTVRTAQLFLILFIAVVVIRNILIEKRIIFPIGFNFLIIWTFFILLFIPNTTFLLRNIGYGVWLIFHVILLLAFANCVRSEESALIVMKLYIISFFINSIFLIGEFIVAYFELFDIPFMPLSFRGRVPRVALFTYEPSYFATYLIPGLVLTIYLWIKNCRIFKKKNFFWLTFFQISGVIALFLSTGRSGYVVFFLFMVYLIFEHIYIFIKNKKFNVRLIIFIFIFLIGFSILFYIFKRHYGTDVLEKIFVRTGIFTSEKATFMQRIFTATDTFKVFLNHRVIGVSLGGIPAGRGELGGTIVTSQSEAKGLEGMIVIIEVLAASGIVGFIFFILYFLKLSVKPLFEDNIILKALAISLIFGFLILQFNQNIQRLYFWLHIAVLSMFYSVYGKGKERFMRLKTFW